MIMAFLFSQSLILNLKTTEAHIVSQWILDTVLTLKAKHAKEWTLSRTVFRIIIVDADGLVLWREEP